MSVPQVNSYNKYQGNGVTTEFSVGFPYNNKSDVKVYLRRLNDIQQVLEENTDYEWINDTTIRFPAILTHTVEIDGEEVEEQYTVQDVLEEGDILAIYRETPIASDYNFENQKRLFPEEVTHSDDLGIMLIQELSAIFSRTLTVDETSPVTPEELVNDLNTLVERAEEYAGQASSSADLAQAWAIKTDGPVSGGEYSSKYYAEQILPIASDITTVAGNTTNINKVANDINRVGLVADDISSVHTVAIDISNVIDVAANIADVNTAAANITDIQNASANALLAKNWAIKMDGAVEGSDYSAKYNAKLAQTAAEEASQSAALVKTNLPLLYHFWSDHKINDVCYLRGDTFSWQSGKVYQTAIKHLLKDILMDRFYIIPIGGLSTKFYRSPDDDTSTQFAWSQGFSVLYTDNEFPEVGDDIYYNGAVVDTVDVFSTSTSSYLTVTGDTKKYYRDVSLDESTYYAWVYNTSEVYYTTSDTPENLDDAYTKSGGVFTVTATVDTVALPPTAQTETIEGNTITYYVGADTHKIALSDQESTVLDIYNACGVAWYYIVDYTNIRFKLPRKNPAKKELLILPETLGVRGNGKTLTWYDNYGNSWGTMSDTSADYNIQLAGAGSVGSNVGSGTYASVNAGRRYYAIGITPDVEKSGLVADLSSISRVFSGNKYLYFYVGNFTQTALENTAGLNAELFNDKADRNLNNVDNNIDFIIDSQEATAENNYTWYRLYKSGWVEQGGYHDHGSAANSFSDTINLPIEMQDTNYTAFAIINTSTQGQVGIEVSEKNTVSIKVRAYPNYGNSYTQRYSSWEVKGKADLT